MNLLKTMSVSTFDPRDVPLPIEHYMRTKNTSRTTLWRWENEGLRILHVGGKRFIRPSDWSAFLEQQHAKAKEPQP
jgi:hypothetical protein